MAGKRKGKPRIALFLSVLFAAAQILAVNALADDAEQLKLLPGQWVYSDSIEEEEADGEARSEDLAFLTLREDGSMTLRCCGTDGEYVCTCGGTWSSEFVPDGMDRLTLLFTSTDHPLHAGSEYNVECVFSFYTESWAENDTRYTYLILEEGICSGVAPLEEVYGYNEVALHREQGPNMRVVNCNSYVSLRAKRSTSSRRLAKVPLGALVLAFPEEGDGNGFIACSYHGQFGFILKEYLEPAE